MNRVPTQIINRVAGKKHELQVIAPAHHRRIAARALETARADPRIPFVTFLLPLSRRRLGALARLGARPLGVVEHAGVPFRKFRLETAGA